MDEQLPHFNLETMSGVFPGTRSKRFNTLKLAAINSPESKGSEEARSGAINNPHSGLQAALWAKALWFEDPPAVVVTDSAGEILTQIEGAVNKAGSGGSEADLGVGERFGQSTVFDQIEQKLRNKTYQLVSCGTCVFWKRSSGKPKDDSLGGECRWQIALGDNSLAQAKLPLEKLSAELRPQSAFTLSCDHWQHSREDIALDAPPTAERPDAMDFGSDTQTDVNLEESTKAHVPWRYHEWLRGIGARFGWRKERAIRSGTSAKSTSLVLEQLNRSGVGAGTEPCLGCHGRIANLGALVVETDEGDQQTYSVWRCRVCAATYLNSWIDRWERLDTLETVETLYRLAPTEATHLLEQIHSVSAGDHPQQSSTRVQERLWFESFIAGRLPLSQQIRHGR